MKLLIVAAASGAVFGLWVVRVYNRLVRLRNAAENAFSTVDVQLKQRCDLVPNVVAAVKGYMEHERETLRRLTELRARAVSGELSNTERLEADTGMSRLLHRVMALVERYPELKASRSVDDLQRTLNEVEAQIAAARRTYNAAVTELNTGIDLFPTNLVAGTLGFSARPLFTADEAERTAPRAVTA